MCWGKRSGANLRVVPPRDRGIIRGVHSRTALGGNSGERSGGGSWGCRGAATAIGAAGDAGAAAGAAGVRRRRLGL